MTIYRRNLPPRPRRMLDLPIDDKGYPVPWFVAWFDGKPDHRIADGEKYKPAIQHKLCWVCGQKLGAYKAFLIGPMCAINRVTAEPPMHRECAAYSACACPFLTRPKAKRREHHYPTSDLSETGKMIRRNPGVVLVWVTKRFSIFQPEGGGVMFNLGKPAATEWYAEGRQATRAEVMESFESGCPILEQEAIRESEQALRAYQYMKAEALKLIPKE